jgi:radical SAM protein (TIGR01212 family)
MQKYGVKTAKIALNAGFSCPHIIKTGRGCVYCGEGCHNKNNILLSGSEIITQFNEKKAALSKKWKSAKYIAYFQAGSNTFAPLCELKKIYESVLSEENLAGIDIATRPDCVDRETAEYLGMLNLKTDVTVELGLQTCHDKTAEFINRGYTLDVFEKTYKLLAKYKIPVSVHIINGLPGENSEMMLETAKYVASLCPLPLGVKIHMLYIEPKTELCELYNSGQIKLLSKEEYINIAVSQLEILPPQIVIMRLTGDPDSRNPQAEPNWAQKKFGVLNDMDKKLEKSGAYQGRLSKFAAVFPHFPQKEEEESKSLTNILSMAKRLFDISIKENGVYADFTMGNGNDTLYIKRACPSGRLYAFDIQKEAVENTKKRLESENCFDENVHLIHDSHANFKKYIPGQPGLDGALFNLGYLPGGDKSITTKTDSTIDCLKNALEMLNFGGVVAVCVYPGHEEGEKEGEKILEFAKSLEKKRFDCLCHRLVNIPEAPYIIAFQKKK